MSARLTFWPANLSTLLPGLEAKLLENRERCIHGQAVYIQDAGLLDHVVGIVCFINVYCHAVRIVGKLCDSVDDQAIVLFAIV